MATSVWNLMMAGMAAGLLAACARGEPAPSPRQAGQDGAVEDAASATWTHRHTAPPVGPSPRTALMYRPQPMREVAAAMRARQRPAASVGVAKDGAAAQVAAGRPVRIPSSSGAHSMTCVVGFLSTAGG